MKVLNGCLLPLQKRRVRGQGLILKSIASNSSVVYSKEGGGGGKAAWAEGPNVRVHDPDSRPAENRSQGQTFENSFSK